MTWAMNGKYTMAKALPAPHPLAWNMRFAGAVSTTCIQDYDWSTAVLRMNTGPLMLPMGIRMEMPWCCHSGAMIRTQKA